MLTFENKHKRITIIAETRVEQLTKAQDEIFEYNEQHSDTCYRCQVKVKVGEGKLKTNHMLSCASCMRSAHAYGCAKEAETSPWTQLAE
jgi:hypothetical protein